MLASVSWPIIERIHILGDFAISPHGVFVAIGFLAGAQVLLRRAQVRGVARHYVPNISDVISNIVTRAAIGGILGARLFYVISHWENFSGDVLGPLRIWEGGLTLGGGIAGAFLLGVPWVWKRKLSVLLLTDSLVVGLALGIWIGRIGDLIIGEHLGGETDFFLGWRCTGEFLDGRLMDPVPYTGPMVQGCFDTAVHQTALYDFLAGALIFGLLLWLERKPRFDGYFGAVFGLAYGSFRFISDFSRDADKDLVAGLTGTQVTAIAVIVVILAWLMGARPWTLNTPWAWNPPEKPEWLTPPPGPPPAEETADSTESDEVAPVVVDDEPEEAVTVGSEDAEEA